MSNLKLNFAAIIFAIFTLTSCQKDNLSDLQMTAKTAPTTTISNSDRDVPAGGIHLVNEAVKTQASKAVYEKQAQSRSKALYGVECGTTFTTTTEGQGNSLDASRYPDCVASVGDPFDGADMIFHFVVEETPEMIMQHDISIKDLGADLDLFVFSLDRFGFINECKAVSITIGYDDETVSMQDLAPGCYVIMVDGYAADVAGEFTFEMACSAVSANPPSITVTGINMAEVGQNNVTTGTFRQMNATDWKEFGVDGAEFDFVEMNRDEWSVYLRDESRGVTIQLDVNRAKVVYSDDEGNNFDLYDIYTSSDKMNGRLTKIVTFQNADGIVGHYTNYDAANLAWIETSENPEGNNFEFTEINRDDWSVYLRDAGRGVTIKLDLHRAKVVYSEDNGNSFDLYDIINAE